MNQRIIGSAAAVAAVVLCTMAAPARAQSDADRLEKLERAVELLQKRNAELEQEVRGLPQQKVWARACDSRRKCTAGC